MSLTIISSCCLWIFSPCIIHSNLMKADQNSAIIKTETKTPVSLSSYVSGPLEPEGVGGLSVKSAAGGTNCPAERHLETRKALLFMPDALIHFHRLSISVFLSIIHFGQSISLLVLCTFVNTPLLLQTVSLLLHRCSSSAFVHLCSVYFYWHAACPLQHM